MIIGVGCKARQGKDTAANWLRDKYGFTKIGFADTLYEECRNCKIEWKIDNGYYGFFISSNNEILKVELNEQMIDWFYDQELYIGWEREMGYRCYDGMTEKDSLLLQWWATFRRKLFGEDYWVKIVKKKMMRMLFDNKLTEFVISDVRFKNETKMITDLGGEIWKVERYGWAEADMNLPRNYNFIPHLVKYIDPNWNGDPNHQSEVDLDDYKFDRVLVNDGSLEDLYRKIDEIMKGKVK